MPETVCGGGVVSSVSSAGIVHTDKGEREMERKVYENYLQKTIFRKDGVKKSPTKDYFSTIMTLTYSVERN